jgi:hypothetical protein
LEEEKKKKKSIKSTWNGAGRREAKEALFTFHLEKEIYENDSIVHCFCLAGGMEGLF